MASGCPLACRSAYWSVSGCPSAYQLGCWWGSESAFFTALGGISAHVAPGGPVDDVNGSYAKWFAATGAAVVLQRPDFHVFGTATALEGTSQLVSQLRRRLTAGGETE